MINGGDAEVSAREAGARITDGHHLRTNLPEQVSTVGKLQDVAAPEHSVSPTIPRGAGQVHGAKIGTEDIGLGK